MVKNESYEDIEIIFPDESRPGTLEEMLYLKNIKERRLFINSEINPMVAEEITHHIIQYNIEDKGIPVEKRKPITLHINSCGGSVDDGYAMIDIIKASKTPVYCFTSGYVYSMGFLIMLSGNKRIGTKNSKYLMHDGTSGMINSGSKILDQAEFFRKQDARTKEYVLENTKITSEEYDNNVRKEWYLFAEDALEKGIIDCIIDSLDEVI